MLIKKLVIKIIFTKPSVFKRIFRCFIKCFERFLKLKVNARRIRNGRQTVLCAHDVAVQRKSTFEEYRKVLGAAEGKSQNFPAEVYE